MKVLASTPPGSSMFFLMVPLLQALEADGHDVRVATAPSFAPTVARTGLAFVPAGTDWLESDVQAAFPDVAHHRHDPHGALVAFMVDLFVRRTAVPMATDLRSMIDDWQPDLLLHAPNELGGPTAAEAAGVPHRMVMGGLDNWTDRIGPALAATDDARVAVGLAPAGGDPGWLFADGLVLAEGRGWSTTPLGRAVITWVRPTPPVQPADDVAWLADLPRPLVHVTLGTVFNKIAGPLFTPLALGAARAAASVVVTVGADVDPETIVGLPDNVHVRRYVALDALLESCDAVLAHGGWGTLIASLAAGVPMGAIVLGADQGYNAAILERSGAGIGLAPPDCSPDHIAAVTGRLLTERSLATAAAHQATALLDVPSPAAAARTIAGRASRTATVRT